VSKKTKKFKIAVEEVRVVIMEVAREPRIEMIEKDFRSFQAIVGGNIEAIEFDRSIPESTLYLNEDGIEKRLPLNCVWNGHFLLGDIFISKTNEEGEDVGLTKEEAQKVISILNEMSSDTPVSTPNSLLN
jgi:hypothetical protein